MSAWISRLQVSRYTITKIAEKLDVHTKNVTLRVSLQGSIVLTFMTDDRFQREIASLLDEVGQSNGRTFLVG